MEQDSGITAAGIVAGLLLLLPLLLPLQGPGGWGTALTSVEQHHADAGGLRNIVVYRAQLVDQRLTSCNFPVR